MTEKKTFNWVTGNWSLVTGEKYVWDGFNQIAIYDAGDALQKSMLWGEDINGGFQTAGGVGGLLCVTESSGSYFPAYDGNGNVRAYVDSTGALVAEYEYSPSPELISKTGAKADELAQGTSESNFSFCVFV